MRKTTYNIRKDMIKTDASTAKFFFILAGIVLLIAGALYAYHNFIRTEPLTYYKDIADCKVTVDYKTTYTRSRGRRKSHRNYYVYVTTPEGEPNVKMKSSRSYYNKMLKFAGRSGVTLSFFQTKSGDIFPAYTRGNSATKAGHQYVECFPPAIVNTSALILAGGGVVLMSVGILALRSYRKKSRELAIETAVSGVEYDYDDRSVNDVFMKEFDEALERDPNKYTRSHRSIHDNEPAKEEKPAQNKMTAKERIELMREFDKLTADGKYNYKMHD